MTQRPRSKAEMLAGALERLAEPATRDDPDILRARLTDAEEAAPTEGTP